MSLKAFDTPEILSGKAQRIFDAGFGAVGLYMRPDRCTRSVIDELHAAKVAVWSIWEHGAPTSAVYFNAEQGNRDAFSAVEFASSVGIPAEKPVFFAIDYDASQEDLNGPILEYIATAYEYVRSCGLLLGVYGSGLACSFLKAAGFAHFIWLAQSHGWQGYATSGDDPDIVQGLGSVMGLDSDPDTVYNQAVLW